jgi:chemotaxis protein histidine kinase CheA
VVLQRYLNLKKIVLRVSRLVRVVNGKVKKDIDVLIMAQEGNTT